MGKDAATVTSPHQSRHLPDCPSSDPSSTRKSRVDSPDATTYPLLAGQAGHLGGGDGDDGDDVGVGVG